MDLHCHHRHHQDNLFKYIYICVYIHYHSIKGSKISYWTSSMQEQFRTDRAIYFGHQTSSEDNVCVNYVYFGMDVCSFGML